MLPASSSSLAFQFARPALTVTGTGTGTGLNPEPDRGAWAQTLIDHLGWGLALCDADGRLVYANLAAQREFDRHRSLVVVQGVVRDVGGHDSEWRQGLHEATARQRTRLLFPDGKDGEVPVVVTPMKLDESGPAMALLLIGRRSICSEFGLEMLAVRYGLTHAERRVLSGLIESRSARRIAGDNNVALSTIRTQIQSLRDKFGVKTVEALLVRTGQMPPLHSDPAYGRRKTGEPTMC